MQVRKNNTVADLFHNRFFLLLFFSVTFVLLNRFFVGDWFPDPDVANLWFYSGIFMVLFSILFIEPYYSSPKNVITNAIPLLLVFLSIKSEFENPMPWFVAMTILFGLLALSIAALALEDKNKSPDHKQNKSAEWLKNVVVLCGQGKVLYSAVFLYFLFTYYSTQSFYTLVLLVIWFFILAIDPKKIKSTFGKKNKELDENALGEIFGVQSRKIFLVKLFEDRKDIKKFDVVKFRYSMQDFDKIITGVVFDTYLLNQEKWAKILQLSDPKEEDTKFEKNIVYKVSASDELEKELKVSELAGVVIDGSTIGKIKFEYSKKDDDLQEGDLLELAIGTRRLFYQVVGGITEKEKLEARNETGFIEGEAVQLGEWQDDKLSFQKFGWVPSINTPVFKTTASDIQVQAFTYPDYRLGKIPNTELPSVINLGEAVSHHMALLGVTGSGKSFLAREIIGQIKADTKVICIDFNKEFVSTLNPAPSKIISDEKAKEISEKIDLINSELEKFANQRNNQINIPTEQNNIKEALKTEIIAFLDDTTDNIRVFELPDVSNTTGILDYTKYFFKALFEVAKERQIANNPAKICVVLEEAHTIVPEWNFSGSSDKASQSLVNSIGQITLQGRKYGIGFLVIAQRTANVSKTVLTQCNTVVCFQAFDETSFTFLGNYVGKEMVQTLPNLKQYHAVVAGKAIKANTPMIIDLRR